MSKVSVIIPVYNVEKYLRECLNSVVNQTLKDIEIICVNDGSTDNSLAILQEYAKNDKRIVLINQENKNAGAARNTGLAHATGEYLSFLDSDDFFELNMLEEMYNSAKENSLDIVICDYDKYNTVEKIYKAPKKTLTTDSWDGIIFNYKDVPDGIFTGFLIAAWNKMFSRKFIEKNNLKFQR